MRKIFALIIFVLQTFTVMAVPVKFISSILELEKTVISVHSNSSVIIELPKNSTVTKTGIDRLSKNYWDVEGEQNLIWLSPKSPKEINSIITISTREYRDFSLRISTSPDSKEKLHSVVIKKEALKPLFSNMKEDDKINLLYKDGVSIKGRDIREERERNRNIMDRSSGDELSGKRDEHRFSLSGGMFKVGDKSVFTAKGEYVGAFKLPSGLFMQGAILVDHNSYLKRYGMSAGVGAEPKTIGGFLFADALLYGLGEYETTFHLQLRPVARINLSNVQILAWLGIPVTKDQFTGVTVREAGEALGIYNKALMNGGVQVRAFFKKVYTEFKTAFAGNGVYSVTAKVGYEIIKNLVMVAEFEHSSTGDYEFIQGANSFTSMKISGNYYFGKSNPITGNMKKCLIIDPVYPVIVQARKRLEDKDVSINLEATPQTGYAPLNVSFSATPHGFKGQLTMTWHFTTTFNRKSEQSAPTFTYNSPGTYKAWVEGTDDNGNYAKSNEVEVTVLKSEGGAGRKYKIKSSVKEGSGKIDPLGETTVIEGDLQKYVITPANGWSVLRVYVDGKSSGAVTEYIFNNVKNSHTIEAEFTESTPTFYTIEATSGVNGSISPSGKSKVTKSDDVTFTVSPDPGYEVDIFTVDGKSASLDSDNKYILKNVNANHKLHVTFKKIKFIIKASVKNNQYGSISPAGNIVVEYGSDQTITFTPEDGNKRVVKYYVNGVLHNEVGAVSYKFSNVKSDQEIEVQFDWIYYDVHVVLVKTGNYPCDATLNPAPGWYQYKKGSSPEFNCNPDSNSEVIDFYLNGKSQDKREHYTLNNLDKDYEVRFDIKRRHIPITAEVFASGCVYPGEITSSFNESGSGQGTQEFHLPIGYDITFYFNETQPPSGGNIDHYELTSSRDQTPRVLPLQYTMTNVTNENEWIHIKCVLKNEHEE